MQEYKNVSDFEFHCVQDYVTSYFAQYINDPETSIVADWRGRLFSESEGFI